jgi:cell division protein FtsW (lipid II flippase)
MNLGAAILILGVTCFMIISRGFRAAVLILAACLVGLVILWGYNDRQRGKADRIARNAQLDLPEWRPVKI